MWKTRIERQGDALIARLSSDGDLFPPPSERVDDAVLTVVLEDATDHVKGPTVLEVPEESGAAD